MKRGVLLFDRKPAADIVADFEAALEQFSAIEEELKE